MRTTPVTRQDDDSFCTQCPANGVPVTIRVPTHLKVTVYEQLFYKVEEDERIVLVNKDCKRNLKARTEQMVTEKVIIVDVKRPAAGTLDYDLKFDSKGQSITQYESFVFDRTAEDSANTLAALIPEMSAQTQDQLSTQSDGSDPDPDSRFGKGSAGKSTTFAQSSTFTNRTPMSFDATFVNGDEKDAQENMVVNDGDKPQFENGLIVVERIVAFQVFDINACDFEDNVQGFLAQHLNGCHSCQTNPLTAENHVINTPEQGELQR